MRKVITFGTFDLLHEGHIRILERAKHQGDYLIVGVSSDELNRKKGKLSVFGQNQRVSYVKALRCVDEVFLEESLEQKGEYIKQFDADLLVMGDDWKGKFDWVSCDVMYLPRTEGVSSTDLKHGIEEQVKYVRVLFGDTYIKKHYHCAITIVNELINERIIPIITCEQKLPKGLQVDCLVYFNKPTLDPPDDYKNVPRLVIDHGASVLKWFLASSERFNYFDTIITAGVDHTQALLSFFPESSSMQKIRSIGFIKSRELFFEPRFSRVEIAKKCRLDPEKPIILFAPTWHISRNPDIIEAIRQIQDIENHVASFHPETANLGDLGELNLVDNIDNITLELLKHCDVIISDTSSTIFEAAALGKLTVQVLLKEYADNNSNLYDFPFVAGTADLFCGGFCVKPIEVKNTVSALLSDTSFVERQNTLNKRILKGTTISKDVGRHIATEIKRTSLLKAGNYDHINSRLDVVHENMFFAQNKLIAHGGGNFEKHHASNSLEALKASAKCLDVVELDFVIGANGILIAHDTFEGRYGMKRSFSEVTQEEFASLKYNKVLNTVSFQELLGVLRSSKLRIVCDIKSVDEEYFQVANEIYQHIQNTPFENRIIVQAYSLEDFLVARKIGFNRILLAVWKYYYLNPIGAEAKHFIANCCDISSNSIVGISVPYVNKHMPGPSYLQSEFWEFFSFWKRIYIHGAPPKEYPNILRRNLGLFADSVDNQFEFKDVPSEFRWKEYLFLNPGLIQAGIDNPISATQHFLNYGQKEGRLFRYDLPPNFKFQSYLQKNPDLRRGGICEVNSTKAHWTKYGRYEQRTY